VCSRVCTPFQHRTKLLLVSHNFSNVMINNTSTDEAHYSQPQKLLMSPIRQKHQTTSRTNVNQALENLQQSPRVVTPVTRTAAPPRVQARTHQLSPRNLSRIFLDIGGANCSIAFGENHWTMTPMMNSVIHPVTGK
jgi:hypothetical protein